MSAMVRLLPLVLLLAVLAPASGCRGRPGHPVLATLRTAASTREASEHAPTMSPPEGVLARSLLFLGWQDIESPLRVLRARATPAGAEPRAVQLPRFEAAVLRRYGRRSPTGGQVREAIAVGFCVPVPLTPHAAADLVLDAVF